MNVKRLKQILEQMPDDAEVSGYFEMSGWDIDRVWLSRGGSVLISNFREIPTTPTSEEYPIASTPVFSEDGQSGYVSPFDTLQPQLAMHRDEHELIRCRTLLNSLIAQRKHNRSNYNVCLMPYCREVSELTQSIMRRDEES